MKTAIVGAGIAGLATAIRLQCQGHNVTVFEANSYPGGKLTSFTLEDTYRFDAGPSLFTMPQYVEELFLLANENPEDYFSYKKLNTICNYFWEDGTTCSALADQDAYKEEVQNKIGVSGAILDKAFERSALKYNSIGEIFMRKSLHKWSTWASMDVLKALTKIPQLDLFTTMNKSNEKLLKHPKLVQLFNRFATYNGSNPYDAPGVLNIIPHLEHGIGAFIPTGGMQSISQSLYQLALRKGVQFHFEEKVTQIKLSSNQKKVEGLSTSKKNYAFSTVVCNMDIFFAYNKLMPNLKAPKRILSQEKSSSALIFYWGIKQRFEALDLHNIFFTEDYKAEFEAIFKTKTLSIDPTIYVNITSKYVKEDAPEGCENWFTMINVPHLENQDWETIIPKARQLIIDKLSRILKTPIEPLITCETQLTPELIQSRTQSHLGSLYGTSSNNRYAAFKRHPNFSSNVKNLYFCGGSVHPGGGIPLCLSSAKIIGDLVEENF